jgi:hypothetical protein
MMRLLFMRAHKASFRVGCFPLQQPALCRSRAFGGGSQFPSSQFVPDGTWLGNLCGRFVHRPAAALLRSEYGDARVRIRTTAGVAA